MVKLGVNVDHVATVRQARLGVYPDPVEIAVLAEKAGAEGITIHLREDRRHIQFDDVLRMQKSIKTKLNLEMAIYPDILDIACEIVPDDVCLVPEKRQELTTEGGLDLLANEKALKDGIKKLKDKGITVSVFLDPSESQIKAAKDMGADAVEIHTGRYSDLRDQKEIEHELSTIIDASLVVLDNDLILNAGHGLNYQNVTPIAKIPGMNELNIGHSIISYSLYVGIAQAVKGMKELLLY